MDYNNLSGAFVRRQEIVCTEDEASLYGNAILLEGEPIYIKMNDGSIRQKLGDGVTKLSALPFTDYGQEHVESAEAKALSNIEKAKENLLKEIEIAAEIVQAPGGSKTAVMSQESVSDYVSIHDIVFISGTARMADGVLLEDATFIRSKDYLGGSFLFYVKQPYYVRSIVYYNKDTLEFDSFDKAVANSVKVGKDGCVAMINITLDMSTPITVEDVKNSTALEMLDAKATSEAIRYRHLEEFLLEQGSIIAGNGSMDDNEAFLRSKEYVHGFTTLTVKELFMFRAIVYYNKATLEYDSAVTKIDAQTIDIGKDGCVAKFTITLDMSTPITVEDVKVSTALEGLDFKTNALTVHDMAMVSGGVNMVDGSFSEDVTFIRSKDYLYGTFNFYIQPPYYIRSVVYYNADTLEFDSSVMVNSDMVTVGKDGCVALLNITLDRSTPITVEGLKGSTVLEKMGGEINDLRKQPLVEFTDNHDLHDCSVEIEEEAALETNGMSKVERIYSLFDSLVEANPDYVSKVDAAAELGLTYPVYANGISGHATYAETPAYKIYLYKFVCTNENVNSENIQKRKLFIVCGTHGDETMTMLNAYMFAKQLCNCLDDENFFKFRAAFDVYIVPCLNGYGVYHHQRQNANGVDLNRNYPCKAWKTIGEVGHINYSGIEAGSEFETQLVVALTDTINPDIAVDHHNYSYLPTHFYTTAWCEEILPVTHQCLVDSSIAFLKHLPQYFGTKYRLFHDRLAYSPAYPSDGRYASVDNYWNEKGILLPLTVEVSYGICYNNGELLNGSTVDDYGADAYAVAEYTLRNQMFKYGQWVLNNT
jgi:hypothetical protein